MELTKEHKEAALEQFNDVVDETQEPTLMILRAHLLIEYLLERLLCINLKRGDRLLDDSNLSFRNKLSLMHALDVVPDEYIQAINQLNKLRNKFSHNIESTISISDIDRIGSPLGKIYTEFKHMYPKDLNKLIYELLGSLCGFLLGMITAIEKLHTEESSKPTFDE